MAIGTTSPRERSSMLGLTARGRVTAAATAVADTIKRRQGFPRDPGSAACGLGAAAERGGARVGNPLSIVIGTRTARTVSNELIWVVRVSRYRPGRTSAGREPPGLVTRPAQPSVRLSPSFITPSNR